MKTKWKLFPVLMSLFVAPSLNAGETGTTLSAAGHWEGNIEIPATPLGVRVDLDRNGASWAGTIDIPVQALRGFKLTDAQVKDQAVSFKMAGIPGNPTFNGKLDNTFRTITGDFSQGGQKFPFKLERKAKTPVSGETPSRGIPGKGVVGHWQGSLKPTPVIELRLVLELTNSPAGALEGTMTSVDQGRTRITVSNVTTNEGKLHLEIKSIGGAFEGRLNDNGSEIAGDWQQSGSSLPLVFKRLAQVPVLYRPQEPKPPYPYKEEEVVVENKAAAVKLGGTFTIPAGARPFPAVLLVTGSGQQDRDEAIMGHRPFLVVADYLARKGIAVLRCDDRGIGKSTGNFANSTDSDFVGDALAAVDFLKMRPEVNRHRIGLVGHSEGGIIAPRAAVKSKDIGFIVLLAGPGLPMEDLLVRQGEDISRVMGVGPDDIRKHADLQRELFRLVREEKDPAVLQEKAQKVAHEQLAGLSEEQRKALGVSDAMLEKQLKGLQSPWFKELLTYDPRPTLKKVTCPVLALNGEKDLQVAAKENLPAIRESLLAGGDQHVRCEELPGLNHLFQSCTTGAVSEYSQIEETFNPRALELIADWIQKLE